MPTRTIRPFDILEMTSSSTDTRYQTVRRLNVEALKGNNDTTSPVTEAEETRCMMARISWRDRYKKRQAIVITVRINGLPCRSSIHVASGAALVVERPRSCCEAENTIALCSESFDPLASPITLTFGRGNWWRIGCGTVEKKQLCSFLWRKPATA